MFKHLFQSETFRSKTFWTAILGIAGSVFAGFSGHLDPTVSTVGAAGSLAAIFLRDAISKNTNATHIAIAESATANSRAAELVSGLGKFHGGFQTLNEQFKGLHQLAAANQTGNLQNLIIGELLPLLADSTLPVESFEEYGRKHMTALYNLLKTSTRGWLPLTVLDDRFDAYLRGAASVEPDKFPGFTNSASYTASPPDGGHPIAG